MVSADGAGQTGLPKLRRIFNGSLAHLRLRAVAEHRASNDFRLFLLQEIRHQIAFGGVHQHQIQRKFLGNADGGKDVIRPVAMEKGLALPLQHRQQSFALGVVFRGIVVFPRLALRFAFWYSFALWSCSRMRAATAIRVMGVSSRS